MARVQLALNAANIDEEVRAHGGPGGQPWEFYAVLADAEMPEGALRAAGTDGAGCCGAEPDLARAGSASACC